MSTSRGTMNVIVNQEDTVDNILSWIVNHNME